MFLDISFVKKEPKERGVAVQWVLGSTVSDRE
jgi:hypothetical protein